MSLAYLVECRRWEGGIYLSPHRRMVWVPVSEHRSKDAALRAAKSHAKVNREAVRVLELRLVEVFTGKESK